MVRPTIDLEPHRAYIVDLYRQKISLSDVAKRLLVEYEIQVTPRTIHKRLRAWDEQRNIRLIDSPQLRLRIATLFLECCFRDEDILGILLYEGYQIGQDALIRVRKEMGLRRKVLSEDKAESDKELEHIVRTELERGNIQGYGKTALYYHFRTQGYVASRYVSKVASSNDTLYES